ncbi:MAG: EamA family transporter RarD [Maricaulaceae bacterium]
MTPPAGSVRAGLGFALIAYFMWGFAPLYFKTLQGANPFEILSHRVIWAAVLLIAVIALARGGWGRVRDALGSSKTRYTLLATAVLVSLNWLIFLIGVTSDRVLQVAFAYYLSPLLNVVFGVMLLGERLSRLQAVAVGLAVLGVIAQGLALQGFPVIALAIAITWGLYNLLRKQVKTDGATGLAIETAILLPFALAGAAWLASQGEARFGEDMRWTTLLILGGPVTAAPLFFFALGIRRLKLSTIGFIQYLGPSLQFLTGLAFGEPFTATHALSFGLIWSALAVFTWDAAQAYRRAAPA